MFFTRLTIFAVIFISAAAARATEPACADLDAEVRSGFPPGQFGAFIGGPSKRVETPTRHEPVPDGPLDSITITLDRNVCYGTCPSYSVTLRGDGTASYAGRMYVFFAGKHQFSIPRRTVECLFLQFKKADFWLLADKYVADITDGSAAILTLTVGGQSKSVTDYFGLAVGMPKAVVALEREIDRIAADKWVNGDRETISALQREQFDFGSPAAATMLARAALSGPDDLVYGLIEAGAPLTLPKPTPGSMEKLDAAVVAASTSGRTDIVRALIAKGAFSDSAPANTKENALVGAAGSGNPSTVAEVLKHHPNVNAKDDDGHTALNRMWDAKRIATDKSKIDLLAVARSLLQAGADPNGPDANETTALFSASDENVVRLLLSAGAKLDVRNKYEDTPLLWAASDEAAVALIEAGADTAAKGKYGETIEKHATERKWAKTLALLQGKRDQK